MQQPKGFTLIELLVVVAIIALLMAILLPSFRKAKLQSRDVVCRAYLKQWGTIWAMYCQTNKNSFSEGMVDDAGWHRGEWVICLRRQYDTRSDILRCPMAMERRPDGKEWGGPFNTYYMPLGGSGSKGGEEEPSYGANNWIYNPHPSRKDIQGRPAKYNWRKTTDIKRPNQVPVFADTMWRGGGPSESGRRGDPPYFNGQWTGYDYEMKHFCIDRHNGRVNFLFMDWTVRRVGLKELWKLKWHREFNTEGPWTRAGGCKPQKWPKWMRKFPD
ncbi:MAG: type II secretion system protein [Planctomycetota bacterium]|jgi:prepilin-type N-terminal cleavage/methylation domain-containing protein/prepilin-type processing-associated H-X9-DG protein